MITFIVPAFNEEDNIASTVVTIHAAAADAKLDALEIVIVNDGSTDGTALAAVAALAAAHPDIRPIQNHQNLGLGASIRAGISVAAAPSFMVIPGDNDVSKGTIVMMLKFREEADVILMSPLNKEQRTLFETSCRPSIRPPT